MDDKQGNGQSGGVRITGGNVQARNIAGRDINVVSQIAPVELDQLFHPVIEAIRSGPGDKQPEAMAKVEALKQEVAKGKDADHGVMKKLAEGIVGLVPDALKSLATAFAKPVLSGVAGPVTQFLLSKMLGQ